MITIELNGWTRGPSYMRIFFQSFLKEAQNKKRSQDFPPLSYIKGSKGTKLRQTNQIFSIWEDRGGLCHFNRGTAVGDR